MSLTIPQLVMMNHAAMVNRERNEKRWEIKRKKEKENEAPQDTLTEPDPASDLSKMDSKQMALYYADFLR